MSFDAPRKPRRNSLRIVCEDRTLNKTLNRMIGGVSTPARQKAFTLSLAALLMMVQGCAVAPPAQEPANRVPVPLDRLAVVAAPGATKGIASPTSISSAAEGMAGGALLGVMTVGAAGPLAILALPMVPLYMLAGAAGGATAGQQETEIAAGTLGTSSMTPDVQGELRDKVIMLLRREGLANPAGRNPAADQAAPYGVQNAPVVLQVGLNEVGFVAADGKSKEPSYALFIKAQAQLTDTVTRATLDEMAFEIRSLPHPRQTWLAGEKSPFGAALEEALDQAAERIVLEMFQIYYPKAPDDRAHQTAATPYYTLAPAYPQPTRSKVPGLPHPTPLTGDLNPHFGWESFPRAIDLAGMDGQASRFTDVVYDFRVFAVDRHEKGFGDILRCYFSSGLGCPDVPPYTLGPEIYRREGLSATEHRIETPLTPCAFYAWTVRARFKLDGRPRVTEWSGTYLFAPWKVRRGLLLPGELNMQKRGIDWLLFRAPPAVGSAVCAD